MLSSLLAIVRSSLTSHLSLFPPTNLRSSDSSLLHGCLRTYLRRIARVLQPYCTRVIRAIRVDARSRGVCATAWL